MASEVDTRDARSYLFGPLEKRGVLAGLRAGQLAIIGASFMVALMCLNGLPGSISLPSALASVAAGAALSWVQMAGRGLDEWIPVLFRWASGNVNKSTNWFSTLPLLGTTDPSAKRVDLDAP